MTREEAIKHFTDVTKDKSVFFVARGMDDQKIFDTVARVYEANELALVALQEQEERENPKPLTLEELRQMIGEPVYLEFQGDIIKSSGWDVLKSVKMTEKGDYLEVIRGQLYTINGLERFSFQGGNFFARSYGYTWTAYRHKPKEVQE